MATRAGTSCGVAALVAAVGTLALTTATAQAWAGALDQSFGEAGRVVEGVRFETAWDAVPLEMAEAPDGRIYVLADQTIHSFQADGGRAGAFGGGVVRVADPKGNETKVSSIAVDSQGRVVVAGVAAPTFSRYSARNPPEVPEYAMVARYSPFGVLDPSFGEGGVVLTNFGLPVQTLGPSEIPAPVPQVRAVGITVDAQDRIVLTGTRSAHSEGCNKLGATATRNEAFLARLAQNGAPDPTFGHSTLGTTGVTPLGTLGAIGEPTLGPDGDSYFTVGAGPSCSDPGDAAELVTRFDRSGSVEPGFGSEGWKRLAPGPTGFAPTVFLDGSARPLLWGWRPATLSEAQTGPARVYANVVERLHANGRTDRGFGKDGIATPHIGGKGDFELAAISPSRHGAIYLTGIWWPRARPNVPSRPGRRVFLARLNGTGRLDRRFGHDGWIATRFGLGSEAIGDDVLVQPSGNPVVAGTVASPSLGTGAGLALARYRLGR